MEHLLALPLTFPLAGPCPWVGASMLHFEA
jgi:hypothetical protein